MERLLEMQRRYKNLALAQIDYTIVILSGGEVHSKRGVDVIQQRLNESIPARRTYHKSETRFQSKVIQTYLVPRAASSLECRILLSARLSWLDQGQHPRQSS